MITKEQKKSIQDRLKKSSYRNHEFFTIINSSGILVVLCKYETGIGLTVFDRIFPDGTSNHGGAWPAYPTPETVPDMVKILKKNIKSKFGKNTPVVLDITH